MFQYKNLVCFHKRKKYAEIKKKTSSKKCNNDNTNLIKTTTVNKPLWEKSILQVPDTGKTHITNISIGEYWNIFGVPVLHENVIITFIKRAGGIQKQTILERQNGLVLLNTRVPVSASIWDLKNTFSPLCNVADDMCGSNLYLIIQWPFHCTVLCTYIGSSDPSTALCLHLHWIQWPFHCTVFVPTSDPVTLPLHCVLYLHRIQRPFHCTVFCTYIGSSDPSSALCFVPTSDPVTLPLHCVLYLHRIQWPFHFTLFCTYIGSSDPSTALCFVPTSDPHSDICLLTAFQNKLLLTGAKWSKNKQTNGTAHTPNRFSGLTSVRFLDFSRPL